MDNTDPRYVRSRLKLRAAFLELAHEDPDKLSVSAVCERTGIDRATFYRHFDTMDDLVADALGDLADQATAKWEATSTGSGIQYAESEAITVNYLDHIADNWRLYQWALGPGGSIKTVHALIARSARGVAFELHKLDPTLSDDELHFRATYVAGGIVGACIHWLSTETPAITSQELTHRILRISEQRLDHALY
ncbi:TetR/AcrR family transcriptional regulator [Microbacterium sp. NPDC056044]|uniref:TetR/AcrR family transcriptional regulator n=1 Tax=Microbacterium sp. NPDC056044 TaxID=3345690 RepID=UPI0035DCED5E